MTGRFIRVRGQVQGVGFRPFVWTLAQEYAVQGRVWNDPQGVAIEVFGPGVNAFIAALSSRAPPLARVDAVEVTGFDGPLPDAFEIAPSQGHGAETRVTPDAATCPACLAEIRAPGRRQGYAFTNCTHCGPRFTILHGLPYDRAQTTMAAFALCPACRADYENPTDRRFHAQPIACPDCGPRLWYEVQGTELPGDPITQAATMLAQGGILAIKGLGGFHLACDARNADAVATLRARKHRPSKPFALMASLPALTQIAHLTPHDIALLNDPAAPITLVPSRHILPQGIAPGMATLGVMLPATPLHHLLLDAVQGVLVMTSGNLSGEPQVIHNDEARDKLTPFADAFLMHDRAIARRLDDGVERATPPMILRRARGRVPGTIPLPPGFPDAQVLALGGQMKAAICLTKQSQALLSHHLGDLTDALCLDEFHKALADYTALFNHHPTHIACDLHPGYASTQAAEAMSLPLTRVQHHHAHMAACLGENLWPLNGGPVAAIVLDGTGLGPDGTIWGGEVLLGDYHSFTRRFWLKPAPLIGGDMAARQPWRNALARLDQAGQSRHADHLFAGKPLTLARNAAAKGINAPLSSSAGRLFDAAAACLGLCPDAQSYEGEAAMRLEALAGHTDHPGPSFPITGGEIDPTPWFANPGQFHAASFHTSLARSFAMAARSLVDSGQARAVALTGGCFQNALLLRQTLTFLGDTPTLTHRTTPANDGSLALGQALVALATL